MGLRRYVVVLLAFPLAVAACGGSASAPGQPTATPVAQTIEVSLSDALRIEPAAMTVRAGQPVTFVVTNVGATDHEFFLGDEAAQAEHEAEMAAMGGMMPHDEPNGIAVKPGETKELTYTFDSAGEMLAGCHFASHYAGGMKATIMVTP